ncbi:MAG: NAD-dependent epimerase/dehydratase family protein [Roseburia sp.]
MKKILVTGGTTFVSKYAATYFLEQDYEVYVLNRNTKPQVQGVRLIEADRHDLGDKLSGLAFDAVLDVTAYDETDIRDLVGALDAFDCYIMISSSAVYPETNCQPFSEESPLGANKFWGKYGTDKIAAEKALLERVPDAYILRPPYLYGPMNNVYREAFVFDCAMENRAFYLPEDGGLTLQFFHVRDLCRLMEQIVEKKPEQHILNVGNEDVISIRDWAKLCYECADKTPDFVEVHRDISWRSYFCFHDYEYQLDVWKQNEILPKTMKLQEGLKESYEWYIAHEDQVSKRPYMEYIYEYLITK